MQKNLAKNINFLSILTISKRCWRFRNNCSYSKK